MLKNHGSHDFCVQWCREEEVEDGCWLPTALGTRCCEEQALPSMTGNQQ